MSIRSPRLITCLLCCTPLAATAQTVSIGGIVDAYVASVKGTSRTVQVGDGGSAPSRVNFSIREGLGSGSSVYARLEMGLSLDDGSATFGGGFGSQAYVGAAGRWGAVELGRQLTPLFQNLLATSPFGVNPNWGAAQMIPKTDGQGSSIVSLAPPMRQSNMVRYRYGDVSSPGLRVEVAAAPGEGDVAVGRYLAASVSHRGSNHFISYTNQRLNSGTAAVKAFHVDTQVLSGKYDVGAISLSATYGETSSNAVGALKASTATLGASYSMAPHVFLAEASKRDVKNSTSDADLLVLGYQYQFSQHTLLYVRGLNLQNKGKAANAMARAVVTANSGNDVRAIAIGLRKNF